jgi:hypothetical protein
MSVKMAHVAHRIGLEELAQIGQEEALTNFLPAAVAGFADGDITTLHAPYAGRQAELYGENRYGEGLVARALSQAAIEDGVTPGVLRDFQRHAAGYFLGPRSPYAKMSKSAISIYPEVVAIDGNPLMLPRSPELILDIGACLTGRSYLPDQMNFIQHGVRSFCYSPIVRTHFANAVLLGTYDAVYGEGTSRLISDKQLYIGREDGPAFATDEILANHQALNISAEIADIVICAGAQHTSAEDLERGVTNSYKLLKEGGMLIIRALSRPAADELGTDQIAEWAYTAGFPEQSVRYMADLDSLGALMLTGHFGEREIQTIVLSK